MRAVRWLLLASILAVPSLVWAQSAHQESVAHEVAEHEAGHDSDDAL